MARKGTGLAVAVGAAIAIGAVVAFAATSSKKKKKGLEDVDADADADEDEDTGEPVSPVVPGQTGFQTPPFFPPDLFGGAKTTTASTTGPPVAPSRPAPPVVLPDEDEDEDEDTEATSPTIDLPGGIKIPLPPPGTKIPLPGGGEVEIPSLQAPDVETPAAIPPPPTTSVEQPSVVKQDTANLAALMLGEEATPNWKRKYPELGAWQAARGLKVDQMFGPGSAQRLAQEIGTVPIIRFWPKGTTRETALEPYRNALLTLAGSAEEPRRAQLIMSANREQGQAFASPIVPVKTLVKIGLAA